MSGPEDPPRWSDDPAAPAKLAAMFAAATRDGASDEALSALHTRLGALLDLPPVAAVVQKPIPLYKLSAGALIAGAVLGGALYLRAHDAAHDAAHSATSPMHAAPEIALSVAPGPVASAVPNAAGVSQPAPVDAPLAPAQTAVAPSPKKPLGLGSALPSTISAAQAEATLLERARGALTSDPAKALALTQEHAAQFPRGLLSQEREVIGISALRRLGRSAEADRRAARFDRAYPDSAHQPAVDSTTPR